MPNGYPENQETSNEQDEYYEDEEEQDYQNFSQHSQDMTNENQEEQEIKQPKGSTKKTLVGKRGSKDVSKQSSPSYGKKRGDSDSKNRKEDSPMR